MNSMILIGEYIAYLGGFVAIGVVAAVMTITLVRCLGISGAGSTATGSK